MKVFPKTALRRQDAFFLFSRLVPSKCCFQHPVFWLEDRVILDMKVAKIFHYSLNTEKYLRTFDVCNCLTYIYILKLVVIMIEK